MESGIEYDACEERWEYYKKRYPELVICKEDVKYQNGRGTWKYGFVELSGDCFFNFNEEKIKAFTKNIDCDGNTIESLKECAYKHYSNENCVLMPVTGGMNNVKGKIYYKDSGFVVAGIGHPSNKCYDRPDTFLFYLNEFFHQKESVLDLLSAGKFLSNSIFKVAIQSFNFAELYLFLAGFKSIYEYCKLFYGMDEKFVDRMISKGKRPIVKDSDLKEYIELAKDFWKLQVEIVVKP